MTVISTTLLGVKMYSWLLGAGYWIIAALVGAIGSLIAAFYYEWATQPRLEIIEDDNQPVMGHIQDRQWSPHKFLQAKVRQRPGRCPFKTRRPAWATRATISVDREDGTRAIPVEIVARWSGAPEPLSTVTLGPTIIDIWDISKIPPGQRFDIHANSDQQVSVAVKFEGEPQCWIFSNESYAFQWRNPDWQLPLGTYTVTLRVFYESGMVMRKFRLQNSGTALADFSISLES